MLCTAPVAPCVLSLQMLALCLDDGYWGRMANVAFLPAIVVFMLFIVHFGITQVICALGPVAHMQVCLHFDIDTSVSLYVCVTWYAKLTKRSSNVPAWFWRGGIVVPTTVEWPNTEDSAGSALYQTATPRGAPVTSMDLF